jgi:hypothetical protein
MMVRENAPWIFREFREAMKSWGLAVIIVVWGCWKLGPWIDAKAESEKAIGAAFTKLANDAATFQTRVLNDHCKQNDSLDATVKALTTLLESCRKNQQPAPLSGATS